MPTTPQDHKTKVDAPFTFTANVEVKSKDGKPPTWKTKTFTLPKVDENTANNIPGDITYAAVMAPDDQMAQMRLAFATLEATTASPAAMAALRSLPTGEMLEVIGAWMGESSGSSD